MKKQISFWITESTNIMLRYHTTYKSKDWSQTSVQSDLILKCYCCQGFMWLSILMWHDGEWRQLKCLGLVLVDQDDFGNDYYWSLVLMQCALQCIFRIQCCTIEWMLMYYYFECDQYFLSHASCLLLTLLYMNSEFNVMFIAHCSLFNAIYCSAMFSTIHSNSKQLQHQSACVRFTVTSHFMLQSLPIIFPNIIVSTLIIVYLNLVTHYSCL